MQYESYDVQAIRLSSHSGANMNPSTQAPTLIAQGAAHQQPSPQPPALANSLGDLAVANAGSIPDCIPAGLGDLQNPEHGHGFGELQRATVHTGTELVLLTRPDWLTYTWIHKAEDLRIPELTSPVRCAAGCVLCKSRVNPVLKLIVAGIDVRGGIPVYMHAEIFAKPISGKDQALPPSQRFQIETKNEKFGSQLYRAFSSMAPDGACLRIRREHEKRYVVLPAVVPPGMGIPPDVIFNIGVLIREQLPVVAEELASSFSSAELLAIPGVQRALMLCGI